MKQTIRFMRGLTIMIVRRASVRVAWMTVLLIIGHFLSVGEASAGQGDPIPNGPTPDRIARLADVASFDARQYGAIGDGQTLDTAAIQRAIDACHAAGGGRVVISAGVFLTGSLQLKSRVILQVEEGATLRGSARIGDYDLRTVPLEWGQAFASFALAAAPCLIYAEDAQEIGLAGRGIVDGQGGHLHKKFPNAGDAAARRPMLVRFQHCRAISVRDVTLRDPASFTAFFVHCQDIAIEGVTIRSRQTGNGDGLDFDGCRDVHISRCDFDCGDDAISPQTLHPDWPNENFTVKFTFPGGGTKEQASRLDVAEMLHFHDYMQWARPFDGELPAAVLYLRHLRGVRLENVRLTVAQPDARTFLAGDDIDGLALQDVVGSGPLPSPGLAKLADAHNVTTQDCRVEPGDNVPLLVPPTADEERRLADLRERAAALDKAIQEAADAGRVHSIEPTTSK